jgi:hypothetical protein
MHGPSSGPILAWCPLITLLADAARHIHPGKSVPAKSQTVEARATGQDVQPRELLLPFPLQRVGRGKLDTMIDDKFVMLCLRSAAMVVY